MTRREDIAALRGRLGIVAEWLGAKNAETYDYWHEVMAALEALRDYEVVLESAKRLTAENAELRASRSRAISDGVLAALRKVISEDNN